MIVRRIVMAWIGATLAVASATAQGLEPPTPPPDPPASNAPPPFPLLHRWMRRMAQENPEEFRRLKEARERDPEEFHRMLRTRRDRLRTHHVLDDMGDLPRFRDYVQSLNPAEREQVRERIRQVLERQGGPPHLDGRDAEARRLEGEAAELARQYREATPAERDAIRAQLRVRLEEVFDAGETARRRQIAEIEKRLAELKEVLAQRDADREQIIDRRLLELTDGDPLAW